MPELAQTDHFDPDAQASLMVAVYSHFGPQQGAWHQHRLDQWLHVGAGCLQLWLEGRKILLPKGHCIRIPAHTRHKVACQHAARFESLWCQPLSTQLSLQPQISSPWLQALIQKATEQALKTNWHQGIPKHLLACLTHELQQLQSVAQLNLPYPAASRWLTVFKQQPDLNLVALAAQCHVSARTLRRLVYDETGMSFQVWRQRWRLQQAIDGLHAGQRLADICANIGIAHESSLSKFILKHTGQSPKAFRG